MNHEPVALNNDFGVLLDNVGPENLSDEAFARRALELWQQAGGLLVVRGPALADLSPQALVDWSEVFGRVERENMTGREASMVEGYPVMRIGNIKDASGKRRASFSKVPALKSDADVRYNPQTRRPVWHTDSTFRKSPPIGSVFHCKQAPPSGGETLFADTRAAYAERPCSLIHELRMPRCPIQTKAGSMGSKRCARRLTMTRRSTATRQAIQY
jgi:alpha-ketoglutarate-dependent taurine dioxygenase